MLCDKAVDVVMKLRISSVQQAENRKNLKNVSVS